MTNPVLAGGGNNPFLYYECDRDPTATENGVDVAIINAGYLFFWHNTSSGSMFIYVSGTSGSFIWKKMEGQTITPGAHIANASTDAVTNAPTNLNLLTVLNISGELNAINTRHNDLATKYEDLSSKFNTLMSHLRTQNLQLAS